MKDQRIVASLSKVSAPIDRKEAMLNNILRDVGAAHASLEGERHMQNIDTTVRGRSEPRSIKNRKKKRRRTTPKWILPIAAVLLLAVATVACIPEARAAVLNWLRPAVDAGEFMRTPDRDPEAAAILQQAVESVADQPYTVTVAETKDAAWLAWAERLTVELDEILYDGETVYVGGELKGNTQDLVKLWDEHTHEEYLDGIMSAPPDDMVVCDARILINGSAITTGMNPLGSAGDDATVLAMREAGAVPILIEFPGRDAAGGALTGEQAMTVELRFMEMGALRQVLEAAPPAEDPFAGAACAVLRVEGLTFTAGAGVSDVPELEVPASTPLTGDVLVFSIEEEPDGAHAMIGNDTLSLAGGQLSVLKAEQRIGGTAFTVCFTPPDTWTQAQRGMVAGYAEVEFLVNGENLGGLGEAYLSIQSYSDEHGYQQLLDMGIENPPDVSAWRNCVFTVETRLLQADWANVEQLALQFCVREMVTYNDVAVPEGGRVQVATEPHGWRQDMRIRRFTECPLLLK